MKEKLKYNFLHIISLHYSKFYNCFLLCCAQGRHFFVVPSVKQGRPNAILSGGRKLKKKAHYFFKRHFFLKKGFYEVVFTELPFHIATVFSSKIQW